MISFCSIISADSDGRTCGLVFMGFFPTVLPVVEMMTPRENTSLEVLTGFPSEA